VSCDLRAAATPVDGMAALRDVQAVDSRPPCTELLARTVPQSSIALAE